MRQWKERNKGWAFSEYLCVLVKGLLGSIVNQVSRMSGRQNGVLMAESGWMLSPR